MSSDENLALDLRKIGDLKYGDNHHQRALGIYQVLKGLNVPDDPFDFSHFKQIEGGPLGMTNVDEISKGIDALRGIAASFHLNWKVMPKVSIALKHTNPCGAAYSMSSPREALQRTIEGDPVSISGGTFVSNYEIGESEARALREYMTPEGGLRILDVVCAPYITNDARNILRRAKGACKILINPALGSHALSEIRKGIDVRVALGCMLFQELSTFVLDFSSDYLSWEQKEAWTLTRLRDLVLAREVGAKSWSNTITLAKEGRIIGNGVGQMSRVDSARLSLLKARDRASGSLAYSDSFFPFPDGPQLLVNAGVTHVFTSSGSIRDKDSLAVFRDNGVALCTAPDATVRGFRH